MTVFKGIGKFLKKAKKAISIKNVARGLAVAATGALGAVPGIGAVSDRISSEAGSGAGGGWRAMVRTVEAAQAARASAASEQAVAERRIVAAEEAAGVAGSPPPAAAAAAPAGAPSAVLLLALGLAVLLLLRRA